ncbi:MAG TPA: type II secretion system protein GspG [Candidatus Hydrogenedentes bacterium]|nr:type II secretion system protein GspG [Candidatus Hydrogenedentota bacterium]HOL76379.1 type II secretion system protein GspG [Candidatus Hydrogenedentota bacterium]HPO85417.1 type II secretion system protein GspG [Candidatus Hydrogenedentota bacterium]
MEQNGSTPSRFQRLVRKGCLPLATAAVFLPFVALFALYIQAKRLPTDAPLARMYRAEADIAVLAYAVEVYKDRYGMYPPAGVDGLRIAAQSLSEVASYFGGAPPTDPWDNPYHYIPHTQYTDPKSEALRGPTGFFAPDTFQLYSLGADSDTGVQNPRALRDNITSWDTHRSWRDVYRALTQQYVQQRKQ